MNATLSIDARLVAAATRVAANKSTTLDQLLRDDFVTLTRTVVSQLEELRASGDDRSDADRTRDDLHERT